MSDGGGAGAPAPEGGELAIGRLAAATENGRRDARPEVPGRPRLTT